MTRTEAEKLVAAVVALNVPIGDLDWVVSEISDPVAKKRLVRAVGMILADTLDVLMVALEEFPDLDPDRCLGSGGGGVLS